MQCSHLHCTQTTRVTITQQKIICSMLAPTSEHSWQRKLLCWCTNSEPVNIGRETDMKINCCRGAYGLFSDIQLLRVSTNSVRKEAVTTENLPRWQTKVLKIITCSKSALHLQSIHDRACSDVFETALNL